MFKLILGDIDELNFSDEHLSFRLQLGIYIVGSTSHYIRCVSPVSLGWVPPRDRHFKVDRTHKILFYFILFCKTHFFEFGSGFKPKMPISSFVRGSNQM